ncbi:MAG: amino acid adenylation domain-containing protein [Polyangiales bacterium]
MTAANQPPVDFDPFAQGEIARTAPITPQQRELWSAIQLGGDAANCAYNEAVGVRLVGALDRAALGRALAALVARHDALRSVIASDGSALIVHAQGALVPAEVDFRTEVDPEGAFRALAAREVSTPFDLSTGPLGRAQLAQLADDTFVLLLVFHHIVCDGWSFGVLLGELGALYGAEHTGTPVKLAAAPSYADYAETARASARAPEAQRALSFWLSQYQDELPVLDLPTDRPRPALRGYRAGRIDHDLGSELVVELRGLAKQHGASMFQLLLTGFQTLLARVTGQWDVVVGLPTAGQAHYGQLGLVGHAVNYLPLRAPLAPHHALREALAQTKRLMNVALEHQEVTFGTLLENLPIARDPSRIPLAPVCFNLETAAPDQGFAGLDARIVSIPRTFEAFELFANLVDHKQSVKVELQYNAALFDAETVRGWLQSYEVLLRALVVAQQEPLSKLPVLSRSAREALDTLNQTATPFEREAPLASFIERAVDATPDVDALVFGAERLSYRALDVRANQLAHLLRARGVRPDDIVGVCVRRSIDTVVAQLAVLKAGGAYLPLDPDNPSERLRHMLDDADARLVVTRADSVDVLGDVRGETLLLDALEAELAAQPATRPTHVTQGRHLAYVIYTSGSTGKPKGVLVTHKNFANFLTAMDRALPLSQGGRWLFATSVGFDISLLEIFGTLARGFTVVVHGEGEPTDLPKLITDQAITHFQCTPSQARIQLASAEGRAAFGRLTTLVLGGEALAADLAQSLLDLLTGGRLFNGYGPTETTIYSTMYEVTHVDGSVPIGRPVANTLAYVLDAHGEPCPRGSIGELFIGGAGVTRGYHELPELTAERFVRDPFVREQGARMYRTGDLVRQRAGGELEYLGRNDHQVKVRGYRIELGEIEVALRAHPAVREAVVIAREDRPGDQRLVAYLVCDGAPTVPALRAHLTEVGLPDYMLPSAFVTLPKLPSTASGKVDRRALPPPEGEQSLRIGEHVAPRTDTEAQLAALWQEVLGVGSVSIRDGFFDLGGHSVLAVRLASRVSESFGINVPVSRLFQALDIEQLAAFVDASLLGATASPGEEGLVEIEL